MSVKIIEVGIITKSKEREREIARQNTEVPKDYKGNRRIDSLDKIELDRLDE